MTRLSVSPSESISKPSHSCAMNEAFIIDVVVNFVMNVASLAVVAIFDCYQVFQVSCFISKVAP